MIYLVTGGAGFIGSAVIRHLVKNKNNKIINIDKLTYAGNLATLEDVSHLENYIFYHGDICDRSLIKDILHTHQPNFVMHLAAESHVDKSIDSPMEFLNTNIVGTVVLLQEAHSYWRNLSSDFKNLFRFHHISTDEVFGSLGTEGLFTEKSSYDPSSPYSASKASSDHFVRAWHRTYDLPVLITNCSNNYGPFQFPEKLIPLIILNALEGKKIPIYGNGSQIRDWLFVDDHARALCEVIKHGNLGETYNIGGFNEKTNLQVVSRVCEILDSLRPNIYKLSSYKELITFVEDRPGHDLRYAIDSCKIVSELGWKPNETFDTGLLKTINWYLENQSWLSKINSNQSHSNRQGKI